MLPSAQITAARPERMETGVKITRIDSSILSDYLLARLPEILARQSSVFIKSYGTGYAGTSFRGMSANHTGIYWNDIPLGSPMLGLSDLSLIPVSAGESIEIRHGGGSAAFGSGTAGGSIHLDGKPEFEKKLKLGLEQGIASFNTYNSLLYFKNGNSNLESESKILFNASKNNYTYPDLFTEGSPLKNLEHAESNRVSFIQDLYYKTKNDQLFSIHAWYQTGKRNLAAGMGASDSKAFEEQQSFRSSADWKKFFSKASLRFMTSYIYDRLFYNDPVSRIVSDGSFKTSFSKAEFKHSFFENFQLHAGTDFSYSEAYINDYGIKRNQYLASFYTSLKYRSKSGKINSSVAIRRDFSGLYTCPWTPFAGLEVRIYRSLSFYANAGKNFRIPTLNNLYWHPGGNPALKPENGISSESGLNFENKNKEKMLNYSIRMSGFYSTVKDWIIWLPAGGIIWSPENLKTVMGRGFEYDGMISLHRENYLLQFSGSYAFTVSTNEHIADTYFGKQLIYVPYENANASLRMEYMGYMLSCSETYTGGRYVTPDNTAILPGYALMNLSAGKKFIKDKFSLRIHFEANNVFNETYQSVQWIPMPGRSYGFRLGMEFN
jgi:vitamin B12 transporter